MKMARAGNVTSTTSSCPALEKFNQLLIYLVVWRVGVFYLLYGFSESINDYRILSLAKVVIGTPNGHRFLFPSLMKDGLWEFACFPFYFSKDSVSAFLFDCTQRRGKLLFVGIQYFPRLGH